MSDYIKQLEEDNAKLREKLDVVTKELDDAKAENTHLKMLESARWDTNKITNDLVSVQPMVNKRTFTDIMKAFSNVKRK